MPRQRDVPKTQPWRFTLRAPILPLPSPAGGTLKPGIPSLGSASVSSWIVDCTSIA